MIMMQKKAEERNPLLVPPGEVKGPTQTEFVPQAVCQRAMVQSEDGCSHWLARTNVNPMLDITTRTGANAPYSQPIPGSKM